MTSIITGIAFLVSCICLIITGIFNYNSRYSDLPDKDPFSFLNQFPYEMQDNETMKYSLYFRIMAALTGGLFAVYGIVEFFFLNMYGAKLFSDYAIGSIFIILGVTIFFEFVLTLKDYKYHLLATTSLFVFTCALYAYLGVFTIIDQRNTYNISLAFISFIIGGALLISLFITPLNKWMYLEKSEENGMTTYHRKRISILPVMEWVFLGADALAVLILLFY